MKIKQIWQKTKKPIYDLLVNVIANLIPTLAVHFAVYPIIASQLGKSGNDIFVTIMGVLHAMVSSTGVVLCNTRLLLNKKYEKEDVVGDFSIIFAIFAIIEIVVMSVVSVIYEGFNIISILLICLISTIWAAKDYMIFYFRKNLDFVQILINNIILTVGYGAGLAVFFYTGTKYWQVIYILGYGPAFLHTYFKTKLFNDPIKTTKFFKPAMSKAVVLAISSLVGLIPATCGNLILFPLGEGASSIYTSASIMGKLLSMIYTPLSAVLISYIVKIKTISLKTYSKFLAILSIVGVLGFIACWAVSLPLLKVLYSKWAEESYGLVPFTAATGVCAFIYSVISPIVLNFCHEKWQLIIQISYVSAFVAFGTAVTYYFSAQGLQMIEVLRLFTIAIMIVTMGRVLFAAIVAFTGLGKTNKKLKAAENGEMN